MNRVKLRHTSQKSQQALSRITKSEEVWERLDQILLVLLDAAWWRVNGAMARDHFLESE